MAKITAEMFADLPDDLQQKILKEVPVEHLNEIEMITAGDVSEEGLSKGFHNLFVSMSRTECIVCIMELLQILSNRNFPDDLPMQLRMSAQLVMLKQVLEHAQETIKEQEEGKDGD